MRVPILSTIVTRLGYRLKGIKVWWPCNIYSSAKIGCNVSIGMFSEIGPHVEIGSWTSIGAGVFIPDGVKIGCGCFIGPKVCFSNDRYPPSPRENWEQTIVEDNVSIGANVNILPGIIIKRGSRIGMGTVLVGNVPENDVIAGNPGRSIKKRFKPETTSY